MKLVFVYGAWSTNGRLFDADNLFDDPRGLTGSESSFYHYANQMSLRGHEVTIYMPIKDYVEHKHGSMTIRNFEYYHDAKCGAIAMKPDAVIAWNEPQLLSTIGNTGILRVVNQQLNDFVYCPPDFKNWVDIFTSPSQTHMNYLLSLSNFDESKWKVLPNGVDNSRFASVSPDDIDPNLVVYISSPDRGLHLLLNAWPMILARNPNVKLRIAYNIDSWYEAMSTAEHSWDPGIREISHRASYVMNTLTRLSGKCDVQHLKSISYNEMTKLLSTAAVMAYPCDPIRFTEGFSCSLMEACASNTGVVTTNVDSLEELYGNWLVQVDAVNEDNLGKFADKVSMLLSDAEYRNRMSSVSKLLAERHDYEHLADRLESILIDGIKEKCGSVHDDEEAELESPPFTPDGLELFKAADYKRRGPKHLTKEDAVILLNEGKKLQDKLLPRVQAMQGVAK